MTAPPDDSVLQELTSAAIAVSQFDVAIENGASTDGMRRGVLDAKAPRGCASSYVGWNIARSRQLKRHSITQVDQDVLGRALQRTLERIGRLP